MSKRPKSARAARRALGEAIRAGLRRALDEAVALLPEPGRTAIERLRQHKLAIETIERALVKSDAMPYHDAWKLLWHVAVAYETAQNAGKARRQWEDEERRLAFARKKLEQVAAAIHQMRPGPAATLRHIAENQLSKRPRYAELKQRKKHTVFILVLAGAVEADWLGGIIGDRVIADIASAVFDGDVGPGVVEMVDMIRRRARKPRRARK